MEEPCWKGKNYACFTNHECEYFPCHKGVDEERFNCLFCYCPLYALGPECGGNYMYLQDGVKDCSNCTLPHQPEYYGKIMERFSEIMELAKQKKEDKKE